jgi:hypothetical protein
MSKKEFLVSQRSSVYSKTYVHARELELEDFFFVYFSGTIPPLPPN